MLKLSLEDKIELNELPGRYGDIVDSREWDALDSIFLPEARFEFVGMPVMNGLNEIRTWLEGLGDQHPGGHLTTNIYSSPTENENEASLCFRAIFPVPDASQPQLCLVGHGSYRDIVVKTDQGWRVKSRVAKFGPISQ